MKFSIASTACAILSVVLLNGSSNSNVEAFSTPFAASRSSLTKFNTQTTTTTRLNVVDPSIADDVLNVAMTVAVDEKDYGDAIKTVVIALTLGGGLIPALISANSAMFKTLGGSRPDDEEKEYTPEELKTSLDPTLKETAFRKYVADSGATGPNLPASQLLFANERIPLADIVAVLGRIEDVTSLADWKNLPSTRLMGVSESAPPQWLPRKAFKVYVRKSKFLGWPTDTKTGLPVGGEELQKAEQARVSKKGALISDAALDAVFDSWAWGASIATPDKVNGTLRMVKPGKTEVNLDEFVGAAIRGRSTTFLAAFTFVVIQLVTFGSLFIGPALRMFFDIDIGFGELGR